MIWIMGVLSVAAFFVAGLLTWRGDRDRLNRAPDDAFVNWRDD